MSTCLYTILVKQTDSSGLTLALLATAWIIAWPWIGITGPTAPLFAALAGIAVMWEGFARIAKSRGHSRVHGAAALTVFLTYHAIFFWRISIGKGEELRTCYLALNTILPPALPWLVFWSNLSSKTYSSFKLSSKRKKARISRT